jgi:aldehyde dehydrogenase (NAD+)
LGGKSPAVVDKNADLKIAARRIAWGKWTNCGQTCIAPDYIMCEKDVQQPLIKELQKSITEFYSADPKSCADYGRIINGRHFNRIRKLLSKGNAVIGGEATSDEKDKYIPPTVLTDVPLDAPVMKEEIFGPVLPILTVDSVDHAIQFINKNDKPLALYVFSNDRTVCEKVLQSTSSGGAIANDTLMHAGVDSLPFGGVGPSGMGAYHGKTSFDAWSHQRSVMVKTLSLEVINDVRYPPYTDGKAKLINRLMVAKPYGPYHHLRRFLFKAAIVAGAAAVVMRYFPGLIPFKFGK